MTSVTRARLSVVMAVWAAAPQLGAQSIADRVAAVREGSSEDGSTPQVIDGGPASELLRAQEKKTMTPTTLKRPDSA